MAIIEEVSSGDEERAPSNVERPKREVSSNKVEALPHHSRPLQRLVTNRSQRLSEDKVTELLRQQGTTALWTDLLETALHLLSSQAAEKLNTTWLERLSVAVAIFSKHADLEELQTSAQETGSLMNDFLSAIQKSLLIPAVFLKEEYALTPQDSERQSFWLAGSTVTLQVCQVFCSIAVVQTHILQSIERHANMQDLDSWTTPLSSNVASALLLSFDKHATEHSNLVLVKQILLNYIKPLFSSTPHPMLNPDTGRKLDRRRGGDLFGDSYIDGQWKGFGEEAESAGAVGCWKVYIYLLTLLKKEEFEDVWPLLVPPMMTLLDDHQTYYKQQGIIAVSTFLSKTPPVLLLRTGLNDLIQQSLTTALSFTSETNNITMIRVALLTNLQLIDMLYPATSTGGHSVAPVAYHRRDNRKDPPALLRFNSLCQIYHDCVINIFTYATPKYHFMTLAFSVIPLLVHQLGKGSIRYLNDTLPVLCASLGGSPASRGLATLFTPDTLQMHTNACKAIVAFIKICKDVRRIDRWRGMIMSSAATLWCNIKEQKDAKQVDTVHLEGALKELVQSLLDACGEAAQTDCKRIVKLDPMLFSELVSIAV